MLHHFDGALGLRPCGPDGYWVEILQADTLEKQGKA